MVGTFYASPNPESPAFVEVGKTIKKGDVVCIIEAMKLFNEIEAEIEGTIEKVCLENSAPVEFGQTLFLFANVTNGGHYLAGLSKQQKLPAHFQSSIVRLLLANYY